MLLISKTTLLTHIHCTNFGNFSQNDENNQKKWGNFDQDQKLCIEDTVYTELMIEGI